MSRFGLLISVVVVVALVVFTVTHLSQTQRFAMLVQHANPVWFALALVLQLFTYVCAGAIWRVAAVASGYHLRLSQLARLAIEKLSVDQLMPSGGLSGNLVVLRAMRMLGLPAPIAAEAMLIDILAYYAAYALVTCVAVFVLWLHHDVTAIVVSLVAAFGVVLAAVPTAVMWLLKHRDWRPKGRLLRYRSVQVLQDTMGMVSPQRVLERGRLTKASGLNLTTFILDATTLWALLRATGTDVDILTAFAALVVASLAGTVSLLPGGLGSFEAGSTATLTLLGLPAEAALTGTLLFRGLSLWLPLIPGMILARRDLAQTGNEEANAGGAASAELSPAAPGTPYWTTPTAALFEELESRPEGLSSMDAETRLATTGPNLLGSAHRGPIREAVFSQIRNPLLWLLLFAAIVGMIVGERTDSLIVVAILLLGSLISIVQESRAGQALQRLRERVALRTRVVRDGVEQEVFAASIVPGDILVLSAGTMIAADAVLLQARDLYVGEAALTGEPFAVEKSPGLVAPAAALSSRTNVVHMGTSVRSGTGRSLVVNTGLRTEFGQVAGRLELRPPETEFQVGLRRFGYLLLSLMVVLVFVVFTASALRHHAPIEALLFAVALAVGLAPEMLPAVLATMLARGARRMSQRGVLVRRLEAIENLGNMDVLCTDKTGTLTEGEVTVEATLDPGGQPSRGVLRLCYWNAALQGGLPSPLDRALVALGEREGLEPSRKVDELPFDFVRKRLSVLVQHDQEEALLITKGAVPSVLSICEFVRTPGDEVVPLDIGRRGELESRLAAWSAKGVRVLGIATKRWLVDRPLERESEQGMVFEGFASFRDPAKPGVAKILADLRELGIRVKIVSGDHHAVLEHLAAQIGIPEERAVRGAELAELRDEALWHVVQHSHLFAEIDPTQKERIVLALKKTGHVVGFMGDGINDAPAMHAADVGVSVESATDVAREAADFVLLKPDLNILREGVQEGRATFANTLKYVLITESANLGNMLSMALAAFFLPFLPLLAHQVLLNNLLSDIPSTTLAADSVDSEVVRQPQHWDVNFIRRFMISFGFMSALFDGLTFLVLTQIFRAGPEEFRTAWFAESLLTELFVLLVLRTRRRLWRSRPHALLLGSTLVVAALTFALPLSPLRGPLGFVEIPFDLWLFVCGVTVAYVATVEISKAPLIARLTRITASKAPVHSLRPSHRIWPR